MDESLRELSEHISASLPNDVMSAEIAYGELMVWVRRDAVTRVMSFLRDDSACQFKMLVDLTAADYPARDERFEIVYILLSLQLNHRVRVKVSTDESTPVPSVVDLFPSANWAEREVWDLYGVPFSGHPDLRRLLTDYGFEGHPLRKDFPLTGYVQVRYDPEQRRVVNEPLELSQEFRNFDFLSPWEGLNTLFPGDEKAHTPDTADEEGER